MCTLVYSGSPCNSKLPEHFIKISAKEPGSDNNSTTKAKKWTQSSSVTAMIDWMHFYWLSKTFPPPTFTSWLSLRWIVQMDDI